MGSRARQAGPKAGVSMFEGSLLLAFVQDKNSRREMEICASLSFALMHTDGNNSEHARENFSRALSVAAIQGDLAYDVRLLNGLFAYYCSNSDVQSALNVASRSKEVALKTNNPDDAVLAEWMLAAANFLARNHLVALKHFGAALSHLRARQHHRYSGLLLGGMARCLLYRGSLDRSLECANRAIDEGEKSEPSIHAVSISRPRNFGLFGSGGL
jgi:tetratricopeptide (TPR) repeat protein